MAGWRLFVAAYPEPGVARAWLATLRGAGIEGVRAVSEHAAHLTLLFVGDRGEREVEGVAEGVRRAMAGMEGGLVRATRWAMLPERGEKRAIVVELERPGWLLELHERLARRLCARAVGGKYLPHVTLGRFTPGRRAPQGGVGAWGVPGGGVEVREVRLVRSVLRPEGAEHVEVWRGSLAGHPRGGGDTLA